MSYESYVRTVYNRVYKVVDWEGLPRFVKEMHGYDPDSLWVVLPSEVNHVFTYQSFEVMADSIVNTSDDLEDLIDAYVVVLVSTNSHTVYKVRDFKKTSHRLLKADIIAGTKKCFVGVWDDNHDLIVVGQMNKKGELELL